MEYSYKFRIYPNKEQITQIQRTFGCVRYVYNHYLAYRKELYEKENATFNYYACAKDLTVLKQSLDWLCEVDSTALQSELKNLDNAYQGFFRRVKQGGKPGYPHFKSKHASRKSYKSKCTGNTIRVENNALRMPKLGLVKCQVSKAVEGRILSATISQSASGKYYASICCTDVDIKQYSSTGAAVGIDMGLKHFCTTSDGEVMNNHQYLAKCQKKLARLQRQLSRKSKGSKNREKARLQVARLHERTRNQRLDTLHKLSTQLVKNYDLLCVEGLDIQEMKKDRRFSGMLHDVAWGEFLRQIAYKSEWHHKMMVKVDQYYPSSQICSDCGYQNPDLKKLHIRQWNCPQCKAFHNRTLNSAKNILAEGMRQLA